MHLFGLILQVGILWFLITLFTRSTDSSQSLRETWIVIIGMLIVGFVGSFFLPDLLVYLIQIVALYFLVDKVCGASRAATIRICVWLICRPAAPKLGHAARSMRRPFRTRCFRTIPPGTSFLVPGWYEPSRWDDESMRLN